MFKPTILYVRLPLLTGASSIGGGCGRSRALLTFLAQLSVRYSGLALGLRCWCRGTVIRTPVNVGSNIVAHTHLYTVPEESM